MPRRVRALIVAYHFPPDGAIGGVRPYQFARYFPEFGIDPWVLTVQPQLAEQPDVAFRPEGVPEERLLRTSVDPTFRDGMLALWRRSTQSAPGERSATHPVAPAPTPAAPRRFAKTRDWVLSWLDYTDPHIGWLRPALRRAEEAWRETPFDVLISTSPPRVSALVARELARRHDVPWVMDIRDPWQMRAWEAPGASKLVARHKRNLFLRCLTSAQAIVHNTERLRQSTCAAKPDVAPKTHCVPNGFEPEWAARVQEGPTGSPAFSIGYYGNIMGQRSCSGFLDGLRRWLDSSGAPSSRVSVRFVGSGFEAAAGDISSRGLDDVVSLHPAVPRTQVPELIKDDFVLLSFANQQPLQVPGKTYDYLATGRRILAVTEHDGATADLLSPLAGCAVAERPPEVASALDGFYRDYERGANPRVDRPRVLAEASYRHRAEQFAGLVQSATQASPRPTR
jgi:hypothetical protein